jgi:hypothetical protein
MSTGTSAWLPATLDDVGEILVPLRALIMAALGAAIAWCSFNDLRWVSIAAPIGVAVAGVLVGGIGSSLLPGKPVWAVRVMEWRLLVPAAITTLAAAGVIVVTIELTLPETPKPSTDTKEIIGALSTAITAFLTSAFITWAGDEKDSRLGDWIRDQFQAHYQDG